MTVAEPLTSILFWNTRHNPLASNVVRLAAVHEASIIVLAESAYWSNPSDLLNPLNALPVPGSKPFVHVSTAAKTKYQRLQVFSRLPRTVWRVSREHPHYTIWRLKTAAQKDLLLVVAHFPSVREEQGDGQRKTAIDLRSDLVAVEPYYTKERTYLINFRCV